MFRYTSVVALLATVLPFASAQAEEKPAAEGSDPSATFAQLDANKDGQLTSDEIPAETRRLFERLVRTADKNGDGKLTAEEFTAGLKPAERSDPADAPRRPGDRRPDGKRPPERPDPERLFQRLDANGDGKATLDEVPEPRRKDFKRLIARGDKNGDGALDAAEFKQALPPLAGAPQRPESRGEAKQLFKRLDKNGDGKLTADEAPEERRKFVERMIRRGDKDNDQALSLEEFMAARPERPADGKPPGRPPLGGAPPAGLFKALDADGDGRLSSGEISSAAEVIRKLDANGDGAVTLDEIAPPRALDK